MAGAPRITVVTITCSLCDARAFGWTDQIAAEEAVKVGWKYDSDGWRCFGCVVEQAIR